MDFSLILIVGLIVLIVSGIIIVSVFNKFDVDEYPNKIKDNNSNEELPSKGTEAFGSQQKVMYTQNLFMVDQQQQVDANITDLEGATPQKIKRLIGEGKLEKAFSDAFVLYGENSDLFHLKSRYSNYRQKENFGLISTAEIELTRNQVIKSFIDFIDDTPL